MEQAVQSLKDLRKGVVNERSKDLLLALLIALIGLAGSYLVLGKSIQEPGQRYGQTGFSEISTRSQATSGERLPKNGYQYREEALLVQGTMQAGGVIRISNLLFDTEKSYLLDYGNGIRHRMTSAVVSIRYNSPGLYLVQCYVQENGKWQLFSAETITIRSDGRNAY